MQTLTDKKIFSATTRTLCLLHQQPAQEIDHLIITTIMRAPKKLHSVHPSNLMPFPTSMITGMVWASESTMGSPNRIAIYLVRCFWSKTAVFPGKFLSHNSFRVMQLLNDQFVSDVPSLSKTAQCLRCLPVKSLSTTITRQRPRRWPITCVVRTAITHVTHVKFCWSKTVMDLGTFCPSRTILPR